MTKEIQLPEGPEMIYLEKDENVIAICTKKGCGSLVFKGSDKTQIGLRVLRERVLDHMSFFGETHQVDIIHPRGAEPRVRGAESLISTFGLFDEDKSLGN